MSHKVFPTYFSPDMHSRSSGMSDLNTRSVSDMGVRQLDTLVLQFLTQGESAEGCKVVRNDAPVLENFS